MTVKPRVDLFLYLRRETMTAAVLFEQKRLDILASIAKISLTERV